MNTRRVLVVGASGRFGSAAAQAFAAAGWRVQTLSLRLNEPHDPLPQAQAGGAIDVLVYAANPLYTRWDQELLPHRPPRDGPGAAAGRAVHAARQRLQLRPDHAGAVAPPTPPSAPARARANNAASSKPSWPIAPPAIACAVSSSAPVTSTAMAPAAGSTWRSRRRSFKAGWSTQARPTCRTPGPTCPTWHAASWPWPSA